MFDTTMLGKLADQWRREAARFSELGMDRAAAMSEAHARELVQRMRAWEREALTLDDAAAESGYSYSRLQRLVSDGEIPNAGEPGSPRIRRADLPRRPAPRTNGTGEPELAADVLDSMAGG